MLMDCDLGISRRKGFFGPPLSARVLLQHFLKNSLASIEM